ncbi:MAG: hypothetical protein KF708_10435 [Pirellulales bacterium]|nr:hypothetical protein [Pirellulales bacterium]
MRKTISTTARVGLWAALALAISFGARAQAADALGWKFKEGDKVQYAVLNAQHRLIDASGAEFDIDFAFTTDVTWVVDKVNADGSAELTQTIDRVQLKVNTPFTGEFGFDSGDKDSPAPEGPIWERMGPAIEKMVGGQFKVKVTKRGEVTEVTLPQDLLDIIKEQSEQGGGGGGAGALFMGGNMFGEKAMKDTIQRGIVIFPESADQEWTHVVEEKMGEFATMKFDTKYVRSGTEKKDGKELQKIESKTEMTLELADGAEDGDVVLELIEQEGSGTILFDAAAGQTVSSTSVQKSSMEGEFMGNEVAFETENKVVVVLGTSDNLPKDEEAAEEAPADEKSDK